MNINEAPKNHLRTSTDTLLSVLNPQPDQICIQHIVQALSRENRWSNQSRSKLSVLSHSYRVYHLVLEQTKQPKMLRTALLHDATEAYYRDIGKPLKVLLPDYVKLENRLWLVIAEKYDLYTELPEMIKLADRQDMVAEWESFNKNRTLLETCTPVVFTSLINSHI
jgi:5'-deoxynucleotidase YfbR-like HD superfamily hydrolase